MIDDPEDAPVGECATREGPARSLQDWLARVDIFGLDWATGAACVGTPGDTWFRPGDIYCSDLRRICRSCPVCDACREWAIERDEIGFWGGTTHNDRRRIRAERANGGSN